MTKSTAGSRSTIIERELPHPPEKIWRALTQRSLIKQSAFGPEHASAFKGASYGWQRFIAGLEEVVAGLE